MNTIKELKVKAINDFVSGMDFKEINTEIIGESLRSALGEKPAVRLNYKTDELINEASGKTEKIEKIESLSIIFTIEREINGEMVPFPVEETFLI